MLYTFISLLTGAFKQHASLKKVFICTQKPEKHLKSEWFDDECSLLQKRTVALKRYQRQTSFITWEKYKTLRAEFSELITKKQSDYIWKSELVGNLEIIQKNMECYQQPTQYKK